MRFRVFVILLFISAVCVFSQESDEEDWYLGKPIREIIFTGTKNVSVTELEGLMNSFKGRLFDVDVFMEIQGRLYALEYFDRVTVSTHRYDSAGSEVIIRFNVVERPVIGRINFVGNSGIRRSELLEVINIKVSDIINYAKIRVDIEALTKKYIEKGYQNVTITSSEIQTGDSSVTVVFNIVERDKMFISAIEFQGNTKYSSNTLRSQMSLKKKSLLNDGAYQETKFIADREKIEKYYHDRGYIDANIRDVTRTIEVTAKGTSMILTFMIEEGSEFRFGGVTFEGNIIFTTDQLSKLITSRKGAIVNMTQVEMDLQRVADLYFENGYISNSIMRAPTKDYQTLSLSYNIIIVERSRAYIENIIILGNDKTKTSVILREIPMEAGDVFSKAKVMDAMRNLYNLQFFSMIIPDSMQGSEENLMDLVFTFEEQLTMEIQFGLTFSGSADPDTFPISGLVKWNDRNIMGSGNQLGIELNSSIIDTTTFTVNYMHRWAFGLPLSLGADFSVNYTNRLSAMDNQPPWFFGDEEYAYPDGFISREEYENNGKIPTRDFLMGYEQWYLSVGLSSGYRWSTFLGILGVNGGVRIGQIQNVYDSTLYRPFDPTLREGNNKWTPKNSFYYSLSLDQRDIFYDPSKGYYFYERMGFYGIFDEEREHYIRSDSKAEYFLTLFNFPVTEKWNFKGVLALHTGLSFIFNQAGRPLVIENANKLAVDGMFIGRGWSSRYSDKGHMLLDSWAELRLPIVHGILSFDLFFDMAGKETTEGFYFGINDQGESNFSVKNLFFSYGFGLRFTMPQFPIRLSLAKRFTIEDGVARLYPGALFGDPDKPELGMDLVISFVVSY